MTDWKQESRGYTVRVIRRLYSMFLQDELVSRRVTQGTLRQVMKIATRDLKLKGGNLVIICRDHKQVCAREKDGITFKPWKHNKRYEGRYENLKRSRNL